MPDRLGGRRMLTLTAPVAAAGLLLLALGPGTAVAIAGTLVLALGRSFERGRLAPPANVNGGWVGGGRGAHECRVEGAYRT